MFTGLIEETSTLRAVQPKAAGARLVLDPPGFADEMALGDSLALNGCCLTLADKTEGFAFDLLQESLDRTNLGSQQPGAAINLERALRADARLGGHFVQGHVDTTTTVLETTWKEDDLFLRFELPIDGRAYFVSKGSISINGVSLTVATLDDSSFGVWIIPHTRSLTNLGQLQVGARVNLEYDMLAKYALRFLELQGRNF
jgi:riboflavin synthase